MIAEPVGLPLPSFRTMLDPETGFVSAVTVISSERSLLKTPEPVTSTVVESTVPSTKSIVPEPLITASFVFAKSLSMKVRIPLPAVSTPIALVDKSMDVHEMSFEVAGPNLIPAPADVPMVPVNSPFKSLA